MPGTDILVVSLGGTAGLREADALLVASLRRAGAAVQVAVADKPREWRTFALIELAWALNARRATAAAVSRHEPRAVLYSTSTAALLAPVAGAIRFDAPAADRPGRHGLWQRPAERRRFADAQLLVPWSEEGLREAPPSRARSVVVPIPVEPSGPSVAKDIAAITYGAQPHKKGLDRVLDAWRAARRPGEELVVAGIEAPAAPPPGTRWVGMLARDEYRALLRRARVFVTAPRREDHGIAQLEALADGAQLVTTRSPGPYVALTLASQLDRRLVCDVPGELAHAVRHALDDPRAGYGAHAAELLEPLRPQAVDRVVAAQLLGALLP